MNTQHTEEKSFGKVAALVPRWKRLADKSPWPPRSLTGTWSAGRAIRVSCGPNKRACQQRFGWKWRWRLSISFAYQWPRSYWWFTMCFSGHRTRRTTSPAPRRPTAPSAHRGLDDYRAHARTRTPTFCRWLDMRLQQGWMEEDGTQRGKNASSVWDAGWGGKCWRDAPVFRMQVGRGDGCLSALSNFERFLFLHFLFCCHRPKGMRLSSPSE